MKNILIFLLLSCGFALNNQAQQTGILPIVIDGVAESTWESFNKDTIGNILENTGYSGAGDISGYFQMAWDDSALYLLLTVTDDVLFNSNSTSWQNDNVEFYFDREDFKPLVYDGNNFQLSLVRSETAHPGIYSNNVPISGLKADSILYTLINHGNGYIAEFKLSWYALGYVTSNIPREGSLLGFDVVISDNDSGVRDAILAWNTSGIYNTYESPAVWGSVELFPDHKAGRAVHIDEIPPSIPNNLTYTLLDSEILLRWDKSSDNISVKKYNVYDEFLNLVTSVSDTFCIIPFEAYKEYNFFVSAVDARGNESDISNSITFTPTGTEESLRSVYDEPYLAGQLLILPVDFENMTIYTITGVKVASFDYPCQHINIGKLNAGLYIIKSKPVNGIAFSTKIILR